jgi:hypothetical protein
MLVCKKNEPIVRNQFTTAANQNILRRNPARVCLFVFGIKSNKAIKHLLSPTFVGGRTSHYKSQRQGPGCFQDQLRNSTVFISTLNNASRSD